MALGGDAAHHALGGAIRARWAPESFILTDSGTSALALGLRLAKQLGFTPVALPAYACYDIATATDAAGVPFTFYDIDPLTLAPSADSVREAVERGARCVVAVHLFGVPVDIAALQQVSGPGVLVIEDAAQGAGIHGHGRPAGIHGGLGVISFGRGKGMTGGRGGALFLNRADLSGAFTSLGDRLRRGGRGSPAELVKLGAQWGLARPWLYALPLAVPWLRLGESVYRPAQEPKGLSALAAGIVERTLPMARKEAITRRRTAARLSRVLAEVPGVTPVGRVPRGWEAGWLRLPALLDPGLKDHLDALRLHGVYPGYPMPLSRLPGFGERAIVGGSLPGAERLAAELVTVPVHSLVSPGDETRLLRALREPVPASSS
jgi:dTDP-4-amino-4,6-dideoxygalactose transaminase